VPSNAAGAALSSTLAAQRAASSLPSGTRSHVTAPPVSCATRSARTSICSASASAAACRPRTLSRGALRAARAVARAGRCLEVDAALLFAERLPRRISLHFKLLAMRGAGVLSTVRRRMGLPEHLPCPPPVRIAEAQGLSTAFSATITHLAQLCYLLSVPVVKVPLQRHLSLLQKHRPQAVQPADAGYLLLQRPTVLVELVCQPAPYTHSVCKSTSH